MMHCVVTSISETPKGTLDLDSNTPTAGPVLDTDVPIADSDNSVVGTQPSNSQVPLSNGLISPGSLGRKRLWGDMFGWKNHKQSSEHSKGEQSAAVRPIGSSSQLIACVFQPRQFQKPRLLVLLHPILPYARRKHFMLVNFDYSCALPSNGHTFVTDTANKSDPNELSIAKGEVLIITDKTEKWWRAAKADGTTGSRQYFRFHAVIRSLLMVPRLKLYPLTI